jgi:hypothetical protein
VGGLLGLGLVAAGNVVVFWRGAMPARPTVDAPLAR